MLSRANHRNQVDDQGKSKRLSRFVLVAVGILLATKGVAAQTKDPCSVQQYKVLTPTAIAIRCVDDVSIPGIVDGTGTIVSHDSASYGKAVGSAKVSLFQTEKTWLLLLLSGPLEAGKKYTAALTFTVKCTTTCAAGPTSAVGPISVDIDTTESVTISPSVVDSSPKSFKATSSVGFAVTGKKLAVASGAKDVQRCTISVLDGVNRVTSMTATCSKLSSLPSETPTEADLQAVDPEEVGIYDITFDTLFSTPLIPGPVNFKTIFGNSPKVDPKSRFSPKKAPATKDASQYYINFNWAAGVGTVPAWVLDGQISPKLWMWEGFAFAPLASADVGNNKLSGQTYTDTIDFGFTSQKPFFFRYKPELVLEELLFTPGVKYETDKEFDRDNLLATADLKYYFRGLYRTQSLVTLQRYYGALQQYQTKKKAGGPGSDTLYQPQVDDFRPPLIGYAVDFHTGIETGGALTDTTVDATTGKATADLPSYSIFRFVPQVDGLLELWKFSFNANMTGRFLALTENTVVQTPSNALVLTRINGWKGIGTLTTTYNLDSLGHFALNVVFKDGFAPPTYKRVNAVQAGILIKY
jgi:hypothetical protein